LTFIVTKSLRNRLISYIGTFVVSREVMMLFIITERNRIRRGVQEICHCA